MRSKAWVTYLASMERMLVLADFCVVLEGEGPWMMFVAGLEDFIYYKL